MTTCFVSFIVPERALRLQIAFEESSSHGSSSRLREIESFTGNVYAFAAVPSHKKASRFGIWKFYSWYRGRFGFNGWSSEGLRRKEGGDLPLIGCSLFIYKQLKPGN